MDLDTVVVISGVTYGEYKKFPEQDRFNESWTNNRYNGSTLFIVKGIFTYEEVIFVQNYTNYQLLL